MDKKPDNNDNMITEQLAAAEFADAMHMGYYRCSLNGETVEVNNTLTHLLEYSDKTELIESGVPAELNKHMLEKKSTSGEDEKQRHRTLKIKTKNHKEIWVEIISRTVEVEDGFPIFHEGYLRDIANQVLNQNQLQKENAVFKNVISELHIGLEKEKDLRLKKLKESQDALSDEEIENIKYLNTKLLLVDDDEKLTKAFADFFIQKGLLVQTAMNGQEALDIYHYYKPDIVVSDIKMLGMDGLTLQEKIRDIDNEQDIILVTGEKSKESSMEIMAQMGIPMLLKPVSVRNDLWKTIKELIDKRRG